MKMSRVCSVFFLKSARVFIVCLIAGELSALRCTVEKQYVEDET